MRHLVAASILFIATVSASAQRGAAGAHVSSGHMGGGRIGGFSAPVSRGFSSPAPRSFNSMPRMHWSAPASNFSRGFMSAPRSPQTTFRAPYGYGNRGPGNDRHRPPYRRPYVYSRSTYLVPGWLNYGPYELGYPQFSGYYDTSADASDATNNQLAQDTLPPAQYNEPEDSYRPAYQNQASSASAPPVSEPELTVIFKDGHSQRIHNFALTGSTLIVLDEAASGRETRIPLDKVDLPATEQAARDAGLDFTPPSGS